MVDGTIVGLPALDRQDLPRVAWSLWLLFHSTRLNGARRPEDGEIDVMKCRSRNDVSWHYH